jgi:glycosidase
MKATLLLAAILRLSWAATPLVTKVEPPDWIAEPNGIVLRMLITGHDLVGASVHAPFPTDSVTVSASGTHLFVNLRIPPRAKPGHYPFQVVTVRGAAEAPFALVPALPAQGRFQGFSSDDIIYLLMPDRFANGDRSNDDPEISRGLYDRSKRRYYHGGDFAGIIQHLPYLKDLGVTALWLTPIYDNANRLNYREQYDNQPITDYHGYGAVDFYGVEEHFGTFDQFRELVDRAHAAGLKVIQDQVANHTGPYHPWAQDPPTPTWYNGTEAQHLANTWRTWTLIDPHAAPAAQKSTLEGWFAGILPDLNQNDPEVARYLIQNTLWWIGRTGIDGIRQDTVPYAPRSFWRDWTAAIHTRYPHLRIVGEVFDADPALPAFFQGGRTQFDGVDTGIDTVFDFPLNSAVRKVFSGTAPLRELSKTLAHDALYHDPSQLVTFAGLHDMPRFLNEPGAKPTGLEQAFTFLMTTRGIPMLYYGDEAAMTGGDDPDNRRNFPGGWPEDAHNAFESSGRTPEQQALFARFQRLARLRREMPALRRGKLLELLVEDEAYAFTRTGEAGSALVVFNNAGEPAKLHVPLAGSGIASGRTLTDCLGSAPPVRVNGGVVEILLPPHSSAIYR